MKIGMSDEARVRRIFQTPRIPAGSMPFVGSSRISRSGLWIIAIARPRRCFMPVENRPAGRLASCSSFTDDPTSPQRADRSLRDASLRQAPDWCGRSTKGNSAGVAPTSAPNWGQRFWILLAQPLAENLYRAAGGVNKPYNIILMAVVLPAPFGPRKPKISPCRTSRDRFSTASILYA